jgi:hypothetical protein
MKNSSISLLRNPSYPRNTMRYEISPTFAMFMSNENSLALCIQRFYKSILTFVLSTVYVDFIILQYYH